MASKKKRGWTRWLWQENATQGQKWVVSVLLVLVLAAAYPMLMNRSFVPSPQWQHVAWYVVALCVGAAGLGLWQLHRSGQWRPSGPWQDAGPVKRLLLLLVLLAFVVLLFWVLVAQTLPMAYTRWLGTSAQQAVTVQTYRSAGRYSCRHQFKVQEIRYLFFEFCISGDDYVALPDAPMPALLRLRRSYFGQQVYGLSLAGTEDDQALQEAEPAQNAQEAQTLCTTTITVGTQTSTTVEPC